MRRSDHAACKAGLYDGGTQRQYRASASHKTGPLRALANVLHCGRQLATADARIVDANGKLYAHAMTTCLALEALLV